MLHSLLNGLCLPLNNFLSLFLPIKGWRLIDSFHFELSVLSVQAGGVCVNTIFLKLCELFMNFIGAQSRKKKASLTIYLKQFIVYLWLKIIAMRGNVFMIFCLKFFWYVLKELSSHTLDLNFNPDATIYWQCSGFDICSKVFLTLRILLAVKKDWMKNNSLFFNPVSHKSLIFSIKFVGKLNRTPFSSSLLYSYLIIYG